MDFIVAGLLEQGAPNLALSLAEPFAVSFILYCFMRKLLPSRLNFPSLIAMALFYTLLAGLNVQDVFGTGYHFWMSLIINAWTYFILLILFSGKFLKKLLVWFYFDMLRMMCQAAASISIAGRGFHGDWVRLTTSAKADAPQKLIHMTAYILLFLLLGFLSLSIWRRIIMEKFQPFYLLVIALPMGLRYSLALVITPHMGDWFFGILIGFGMDAAAAYRVLALFGIALGLAADAALLYYVLSYDKRAAIEAELREAGHIMELERKRYREIERRAEEMAKLRHDFNNQLASISHLVRTGEAGAAREMILALSEEINEPLLAPLPNAADGPPSDSSPSEGWRRS
jgi:hypothetical protein